MRETVLLDMGSLSAPKGSLPWVKAVHEKAKAALNDASTAKEHVQAWVGSLRERDHFRLLEDAHGRPFMMWEVFCTTAQPRGLGYDPAAIDAIVAERQSVAALAARQPAIGEHGGSRKPTDSQVDDCQLDSGKGGNQAAYLTARIKRDRPDIAERMIAGEFKSVRQAAITAGIVKSDPRISVRPTPDAVAAMALKHLNNDQLREMVRLIVRGARARLAE